jgi:AmmeMemoRadiSam system protein A
MGNDTNGIDVTLSKEDRTHLLVTARNAILEKLDLPPLAIEKVTSPILDSCRGAFVTLKTSGRLRGCIGHIEGSQPLRQTIEAMANAAAFQDPRFHPLTADEVPSLSIEISILTPLVQITEPEEIEVGKHGLVIESGYNRGLLLPQVAVEYNWNKTVFLEHTCQKAGLPADAWQEPETRIYLFSAEVFGE